MRLGQQVFRDEVLWDVSNPVNGAEPYSVRVCADLGLGCDWFDAIRAHVQQRLDEVKQVGWGCWGASLECMAPSALHACSRCGKMSCSWAACGFCLGSWRADQQHLIGHALIAVALPP